MKRNIRLFHFALQMAAIMVFLTVSVIHVHAFDADASRGTLKGLTGFYVLIEELNPNIAKYNKVQKNHIGTQQLKSNVENRLRAAGIRVLSWDEMMKESGRPILYICVNMYEYEKFWYAYDIRVEVRQLVTLVNQPGKTINGGTWSMNVTGVMNIGQIQTFYDNLGVLLDRFVGAYKTVNRNG